MAGTLTLSAQYYRMTGDADTVLKHSLKLLDIGAMLMGRRQAAKQLDRSDPSYGMLRGIDESDEMMAGWTVNSTELPHFSFSLEAWRGFRDLGSVWSLLGNEHNRSDLIAAGAAMQSEAPQMLEDIGRAMARSVVQGAGPGGVCHPYVAGEGTCSDMIAAGARVSGTVGPYNRRANEPWRSYSGMLWSGGLTAQDVVEIVNFNQHSSRLSRLGVWGGGPDFMNSMESFTEQGHGYGLLQFGLVEPFLLQLYSNMAHDCTRGSWTCFEQRRLPNGTPAGGYSTPSQLTVPLHIKWMLVWVDPNSNAIILNRATPRSWLNQGEMMEVSRAPIAAGRISYSVRSNLGAAIPTVAANVSLDATHSGVPETASPVEVALTLRAPLGCSIKSVEIGGMPWHRFNITEETIQLPSIGRIPLSIETSYDCTD